MAYLGGAFPPAGRISRGVATPTGRSRRRSLRGEGGLPGRGCEDVPTAAPPPLPRLLPTAREALIELVPDAEMGRPQSGWGDLNSRPLDPQSSALSKLRYSPRPLSYRPAPLRTAPAGPGRPPQPS